MRKKKQPKPIPIVKSKRHHYPASQIKKSKRTRFVVNGKVIRRGVRTRIPFKKITPQHRLNGHKWGGFLKEPDPRCPNKIETQDGYYTDLTICEFYCKNHCKQFLEARKLFGRRSSL
jgi:hypothetical protein